MALPVFDKMEDVPEAFRGEYEIRDGKAHPKPPVGDGGKAAIDAEREARKTAEKEAKDAKKALDDLKKENEARDANISADQLEKWKKEREDAVAAEQEKTRAAEAKLEAVEVERAVRALGADSTVNMYLERLDADIMPLVVKMFGRTKTGELAVKGADGALTTDDPKATLLGLKKKWPFLFRGDGSTGSGAEGSNGSDGGSGYDPVAAGKAAASAQKLSRENNALAFR